MAFTHRLPLRQSSPSFARGEPRLAKLEIQRSTLVRRPFLAIEIDDGDSERHHVLAIPNEGFAEYGLNLNLREPENEG